jgi:hypothetical protein
LKIYLDGLELLKECSNGSIEMGQCGVVATAKYPRRESIDPDLFFLTVWNPWDAANSDRFTDCV